MGGIVWEVMLGAFLGSLLGYLAQWWYDKVQSRRLRKKLGSTLRAEVANVGDPLENRGQSGLVYLQEYPTLDLLLAQGAVHPKWEDDLLEHMVHLRRLVSRFNQSADLYNQACLDQVPEPAITHYWRDLNGCSWDLRKALDALIYMGDRLGPIPAILDDSLTLEKKYKRQSKLKSLWQRVRRWIER